MTATSGVSVPWFLRVIIRLLIDVDIPQLSSDGINFGSNCFKYTYSLQSSSTHSPISSSLDAAALENCISFGNKTPSSTSHVVRNRIMLESIPLDVEDLWIRLFDTSGLTEFSFDRYLSLKSLVLGSNTFWYVTQFELNGLPSLQSIIFGKNSTCYTPSLSLTGLIDGLIWIHRSSSTTISQTWWVCICICSFDCVWEWLNGWIDDSDLPKLQSIQLGLDALFGDNRDDRVTITDKPYNFKNTLTMRSEIE